MRPGIIRWSPLLLFVLVAAASVVVLVRDHRRIERSFEANLAAIDNITQARLHAAQGALASARLESGDPTFTTSRPVAELDEAIQLLDDLRSGRSSVLGMESRPLRHEALIPLVDEFEVHLQEFRADLMSGRLDEEDPVAARIRLAELERAAGALERAMYDLVRAQNADEDLRHRIRVGAWILFLLLTGGAFVAVRRTRDHAEEQRRRAEGRYAALATHAAGGLVRTDGSGGVIERTQWWDEMFSPDNGEWKGEPWWSVLPEDEQSRVAGLWKSRADRREPFFLEVRADRDDGAPRWLGSRWARDEHLREDDADSWMGTFIDETERKQVEDQLRQAQRLEAVGRLTSGISHDFNNLLTVILSNAQLLERDGSVPSNALEMVREIGEAADSGRSLIKDLLGFSREAPLDMTPLDLGSAVAEHTRLVRRLLPESIELRVHVPEDGPVVHADHRALQQVLLNLATNARDAMPDGGFLRLEVDRVEADDSFRDEHPWVETGRFGRITMSDRGIGMDADTLARIFDPFFTTKEEGKGTGLGLATVHGLVRQQGGHIHAYSEVGTGTTFRVYLPLAAADRAEPSDPRAGGDAAPAADIVASDEPLRVLVVEDDAAIRRAAARILTRLGHTVTDAASGREALALVEAGSAFDAVISDMSMPDMSGVELARQLRQSGHATPILFTSGYTLHEMAQKGVLPTGATYLPKPWTIEELKSALRKIA